MEWVDSIRSGKMPRWDGQMLIEDAVKTYGEQCVQIAFKNQYDHIQLLIHGQLKEADEKEEKYRRETINYELEGDPM